MNTESSGFNFENHIACPHCGRSKSIGAACTSCGGENAQAEERISGLRQEIVGMGNDVHDLHLPRFDEADGQALRTDTEEGLKAMKRIILERAVVDVGSALNYQPDSRYNNRTGQPLPELVIDSQSRPTPESLSSRLRAYKEEIPVEIEGLEKRYGVAAPKFDGQSGAPIPRNSLRAIIATKQLVFKSPQAAKERERAEDMAALNKELDLGLRGLRGIKQARHEAEMLELQRQRAQFDEQLRQQREAAAAGGQTPVPEEPPPASTTPVIKYGPDPHTPTVIQSPPPGTPSVKR